MKKFILSIVAVAALVALPMGVKAQTEATTATQINATAKIIKPIAILSSGTMNFGTITALVAGGTVVLDPATAKATSSTLSLLTKTGNVSSVQTKTTVPTVTVTGEPSYKYTITLPADGALKLTGPSGATDMVVSTFTDALASGSTGDLGTLDPTGTQSFTIGATLSVNSGQMSGDYSGKFDVTVAYE